MKSITSVRKFQRHAIRDARIVWMKNLKAAAISLRHYLDLFRAARLGSRRPARQSRHSMFVPKLVRSLEKSRIASVLVADAANLVTGKTEMAWLAGETIMAMLATLALVAT